MDRKKYGILSNLYFYCKESFNFRKLGFILSLFLVPTRIMKFLLQNSENNLQVRLE